MFMLISGQNYVYCMTRLGTYLYMKSETIFFIIHRKSYHFYSFQMMQNTEEDEDSPDCHHDYYTIPEGQWLPLFYKQSMNYKKRCTKLKVTVFLIHTLCTELWWSSLPFERFKMIWIFLHENQQKISFFL